MSAAFVVTSAGWVPLGASGLPDTAVTPGSYGDASHVAAFTVDAQGRLTAASNVALAAAGVSSLDAITGAVTLVAGANVTITDNSPSAGEITIAASGAVTSIGNSALVYRYTVAGSDKASIDTGVDTPDAGSNVWTAGDLLEVFIVARTDEAVVLSGVGVTFNNDTGANYDTQLVTGANTTISANVGTGGSSVTANVPGASASANYPGTTSLVCPNFAGTTFYKAGTMMTGEADSTAANELLRFRQFAWRNTAAITRLAVTPVTGGVKLKVGSQLLVYKRLSS